MKIRMFSLFLLLLVSTSLSAQKKYEEREKEATAQVDRKTEADKAAKKAAKEAAKRAEREAMKNNSSPSFIERLVVRRGQTYVVQNDQLEIGTLIMEDKAIIELTQLNTMILIDKAIVGKKCIIKGVGKKGRDGAKGADGLANIVPGRFVDGAPGQNGSNGGDGLNLKLFIDDISFLSPLIIKLNGGMGGTGGNGGNGGTITKSCKDGRKGRGFNGGNSGRPGNGGLGGKLVLLLNNNVSNKAIKFKQTIGIKGKQGIPGKAGKIIRKCGNRNITTTTGKPGELPLPFTFFGPPADDVNFISFPNPPPTTSYFIDRLSIKLPSDATIGDVDNKLTAALNASGYKDMRYYRVDGGFAVVTGIEHINDKGIPRPDPDRFSNEKVLYNKEFTLKNLISSLFISATGYSRVIVFLVSNDSLSTSSKVISREEAVNWFNESKTELPSYLREVPYTTEHRVSALIYEFSKTQNLPMELSKRSEISAEEHLYGANLLPRLSKD